MNARPDPILFNFGDKLKIKQALFGDGQQANSLIQHLWFGMAGANTYPQINAVLQRLGIAVAPSGGHHETHYHVDFRPPGGPVAIESSRSLESAIAASISPASTNLDMAVNLQGEDMLRTLSAAALALAFAGSPDAATRLPTIEPSRVNAKHVGMCNTYDPNDPYNLNNGAGANSLSPTAAIYSYVQSYQKAHLMDIKPTDYTVKYIEQPRYGVIKSITKEGWTHELYVPNEGYAGNDRYVAEVTLKGTKFKVTGFLRPSADVMSDYAAICRRLGLPSAAWKISDAADTNAGDTALSMPTSLLSALADLQLVMADLPGSALGTTVGEGTNTQITLDTNAAGHNWYIDPTPLDNTDDYLPTSDATVFKAKAGSAADGKMDMLSVLLHEYGHALGLEHSANAADFMAASLQPGVRKLPSSEELALMARLVAELKNANGQALTPALSQGERGQDNPFAPSPLSALGLLPLGFMRRNDGKGSANAGVAMGAATAVHTDYLTAINTTLANGSFSAGQNGTIDQWESIGNVGATPAVAFQAVTLGESTTAQAHLGQAFVLSAQDRFLTFTVSGLDLQTNSIEQNGVFTAAPQDAFEVALQNANTGANLLAAGNSNLGTSHSDALLNLQLANSSAGAALQERAVSGLRHTDNADGSRTYVLDLSGITAGTAVNLSFDLIGFGLTASQRGSKVNISDVRLISTPVAVNDAATLAEDGSATLSVQANDLNADIASGSSTGAAGFAPRLVASAQHGQVSVNAANGVFSGFVYTPDANFFGADSFTYQYSNAAGTELSNAATVTLTVTPVNDAPVAADVSVSTAEDTVLAINLVATDADNTSAELVFSIQTQPAHGSLVQNADGSYSYSYSYTPDGNYFGADRKVAPVV